MTNLGRHASSHAAARNCMKLSQTTCLSFPYASPISRQQGLYNTLCGEENKETWTKIRNEVRLYGVSISTTHDMRLAARLALHSTIAAVTSSIGNSRHTLLVISKVLLACFQWSARMSRPVYPRENLPNAFLMRQRCKEQQRYLHPPRQSREKL